MIFCAAITEQNLGGFRKLCLKKRKKLLDTKPNILAEELKSAAGKALGFAQKIVYYCKETIGYLLGKANAQANALGKLAPNQTKSEEGK